MPQYFVKKLIRNSLKSNYFYMMFSVRALSTLFPLIATYIFSRFIAALETNKPITEALVILFIGLLFQIMDNLLRLYSKTRIEYFCGKTMVNLQNTLIKNLPTQLQTKKELIQACINLSSSVNSLIVYIKESGITGIVNFVLVPVILFFIDTKIFFLEVIFIAFYLVMTLVFNKKYEKYYEQYNGAREDYYANLFASKPTTENTEKLFQHYNLVQDFVFFMWNTFQNAVALFQFVIPLVVAIDILNGTKHISDLVLIVGYTRESQTFLNEFSTSYERLMEVEAGIKRLEKDTSILR